MNKPWHCPYCLLGLCRLCTGRVVVLRPWGSAREEPCGHQHPVRRAA